MILLSIILAIIGVLLLGVFFLSTLSDKKDMNKQVPCKIKKDFDHKCYFFYERVPDSNVTHSDKRLIDAEKKAFMRGIEIGYLMNKNEKA